MNLNPLNDIFFILNLTFLEQINAYLQRVLYKFYCWVFLLHFEWYLQGSLKPIPTKCCILQSRLVGEVSNISVPVGSSAQFTCLQLYLKGNNIVWRRGFEVCNKSSKVVVYLFRYFLHFPHFFTFSSPILLFIFYISPLFSFLLPFLPFPDSSFIFCLSHLHFLPFPPSLLAFPTFTSCLFHLHFLPLPPSLPAFIFWFHISRHLIFFHFLNFFSFSFLPPSPSAILLVIMAPPFPYSFFFSPYISLLHFLHFFSFLFNPLVSFHTLSPHFMLCFYFPKLSKLSHFTFHIIVFLFFFKYSIANASFFKISTLNFSLLNLFYIKTFFSL